MFTGLIENKGTITHIEDFFNGKKMTVEASPAFIKRLKTGDSVSVNGVCSTALNLTENSFSIDYLEETLKKTSFHSAKLHDIVNLETSATLQTALGGHMVSGHVDECGKIKQFETDGTWSVLTITFSEAFKPYVIPKGSITLDGISLTIVDLFQDAFTCHIIPHTLAETTLSRKQTGDPINIEYDMVGKYLYHFYSLSKEGVRHE